MLTRSEISEIVKRTRLLAPNEAKHSISAGAEAFVAMARKTGVPRRIAESWRKPFTKEAGFWFKLTSIESRKDLVEAAVHSKKLLGHVRTMAKRGKLEMLDFIEQNSEELDRLAGKAELGKTMSDSELTRFFMLSRAFSTVPLGSRMIHHLGANLTTEFQSEFRTSVLPELNRQIKQLHAAEKN